MRGNVAGAFFIGVAVGVAGLGAALWQSGALNVPSVLAGNKRATPSADAVKIPSSPAAQPAAPESDADHVAPPADASRGVSVGKPPLHSLAMPIMGLDPRTLHDTFDDQREGHKHEALDIPSPKGTPVHAIDEGNVVKLFKSKEGGLTVYQFNDSGTWSYYYAHLDKYAPGLTEGTLLRKGDVLGYVGSTGNASEEAPHLHLAVNQLGADKKWWEGTPIDPLPLLHR